MEVRQEENTHSDDQVSIWSIRRKLFVAYFWVFALLFVLVTAIAAWLEYSQVTNIKQLAELAMAAMGVASGRILWLAAFAIISVEVSNVIVEYWLVERYKRGRKEEREKWQAWYERQQAAFREGRPFDEPPPGVGEKGNRTLLLARSSFERVFALCGTYNSAK